MGVVSGGQDAGACGPDGAGVAVVEVGGGVKAEAALAVLVVIPVEEVLAMRAGSLDGKSLSPRPNPPPRPPEPRRGT